MNKKIVIIGGLNLDICHAIKDNIKMNESNIGDISFSLGGVSYNIFINLFRLNVDVEFISSIGDDYFSKLALKMLVKENVSIEKIKINNKTSMPIYSYVLDNYNDMFLAVNDMKAIGYLNIDYIKKFEDILEKANYIIIDTNLKQDVIEYLCINFPNKILVDGVSYIKVKKLKNVLQYIHSIKINKNELISLLDKNEVNINIYKEINCLLNKGLKNIFVSDGRNGIYYNDDLTIKKLTNKPFEVINASGAGDALASGIFYGIINDLNKYEQVINGLKIVKYTLLSNSSTSQNISEKILKKGG